VELVFPPGTPPARSGPLSRFLPPLDIGSTTRALEALDAEGEYLLDPFGSSPTFLLEAARRRGVVVAANNPVTRFVLRRTVLPFRLTDLQSALAHLSAAAMDGTRLEPFMLDLYRSECGRCGRPVAVDTFVWERELDVPVLKVYACTQCGHSGEEPTTPGDRERALAYPRRGLPYARALEQAASADDPDRQNVEAALSVYPGRALYGLITLVNKLEQLGLEEASREAAQALFLSAFESVNSLWGYPEGRTRPRQLVASPRFREDNVWRALERGLDEWALADPELEWMEWPAQALPGPGKMAVFPGPVRELAETLPSGGRPLVATVLPRPNQAYWTLSALWASWLWGREAAAPIKVVLRRRRYDWVWHAGALKNAIQALAPALPESTVLLGLMPEAEPGFVSAALAGFDSAGCRLTGRSLRMTDGQAQFAWVVERRPPPAASSQPMRRAIVTSAVSFLRAYGEPATFATLHAVVWSDLAAARLPGAWWDHESGPPLQVINDVLEGLLAEPETFVRLEGKADPESGLYWLYDPRGAAGPLSDRIEVAVLAEVQRAEEIEALGLEARLCRTFRGAHTPDRRLVAACLSSYASEEAPGHWRLRPEDALPARQSDLSEVRRQVEGLGGQLGYEVRSTGFIQWVKPDGEAQFVFQVQDTAAIGEAMAAGVTPPRIVVLPGGRAALIAEKERRDPRWRAWLAAGGRVVKFRHIRRLAAESTLQPANFDSRLGIDPPEHADPQLPLL
jgi:hypothetical protein